MTRDHYVVTCEHGGHDVPEPYRPLLQNHLELLATHHGYDPGALGMAQALAQALDAPLFASTVTRLLIDVNRSLGNPRLYSEATRGAPPKVRRDILHAHYLPHRTAIESHLDARIAEGHRVWHIASHSFTPELEGQVRHADVGLLYDPSRPLELSLCRRWERALVAREPRLRVRRNYPYAGTADGLTTALRRKFAADSYAGVDLELNQRFVIDARDGFAAVRDAVIAALEEAIAAD